MSPSLSLVTILAITYIASILIRADVARTSWRGMPNLIGRANNGWLTVLTNFTRNDVRPRHDALFAEAMHEARYVLPLLAWHATIEKRLSLCFVLLSAIEREYRRCLSALHQKLLALWHRNLIFPSSTLIRLSCVPLRRRIKIARSFQMKSRCAIGNPVLVASTITFKH